MQGGHGGDANDDASAIPTDTPSYAQTGIEGLDAILKGGLPLHRAYLVHGKYGSGKTTLCLQYCREGSLRGERVLYVTTTESAGQLSQVAASHGWSLDGIVVYYLDVREIVGKGTPQSVFRPAEVELPRTIDVLLETIERVAPQRLVIDSLSELRLLADDPRWFRRQILALKDALESRRCTMLVCDDQHANHQAVQTMMHGVIDLETLPTDYGPDRRRLRIAKLRGHVYCSGFHDFTIRTGGIEVYPRVIAAEHRPMPEDTVCSSGVPVLDAMLGGGMDAGTATLLLGPAGTGKSIVAMQIATAAAQRGERAAVYAFDERLQTLLRRSAGLGIELQAEVDQGKIEIQQVDPAELSPGQFSHIVRGAADERNVRMVIIDSLTGYAHAMPNERLLALYLHELLAYLNQRQISVLMVMTQHGLPGTTRQSAFDLSYIADSVILFHSFEYRGELRKAISVYKRRSGPHEPWLRELRFGPQGICIGDPLRSFHSILSGTPVFVGDALPDVRETDPLG